MAERQKGMGRGLAAILSVAPRDDVEELRHVPVELIDPSPHQPRRSFDEEPLARPRRSRSAPRGVLQPVLVRPLAGGRYELIAGERRWRAARVAELETIPAIVRHHDDAASLEVALIENMAREDLNPVEEARACAALVEELGLTREDVGLRVGRSRVAVSNLIRLLDLPDEVARADRARRSQRGPRPRAAARRRPRRAPARSLASRGRRPLVGPRARVPRAQRRRRHRIGPGRAPAPHPPAAPPRPAGRRSTRSPTASRSPSAARSTSRPARAPATASSSASSRSTTRSSSPCAFARAPRRSSRIASVGRLAQSVRALL